MKIVLYGVLLSPPCRSVLMASKLIGVDIKLQRVNLAKGEQHSPEFQKMNLQHEVPVIDDNGFILTESRAIITYMFNKYGKDDSLYPADPQKRAIVDQRLYLDMGTIGKPFADYFHTCVLGSAPHDEALFKKLSEPFVFLEQMLEGSAFVAGSSITLADVAILATVASMEIVDVVDMSKFPNIRKWSAKCREVIPDHDEINHKGALEFKALWDKLHTLKKLKATNVNTQKMISALSKGQN